MHLIPYLYTNPLIKVRGYYMVIFKLINYQEANSKVNLNSPLERMYEGNLLYIGPNTFSKNYGNK
ncbi:hypothetical protein GCM10011418_36300 [Sphingobacterium alkalisoli]|nr:hypothetical protein GCM10011418_36300 [Sphingobacterium alkalisoli]